MGILYVVFKYWRKLVSLYDEDGNVLKTVERFKNVQLPESIRRAVKKRFPKWEIVKDVYEVKYTAATGAKKVYKMKLKNGNETIRIKPIYTGMAQLLAVLPPVCHHGIDPIKLTHIPRRVGCGG